MMRALGHDFVLRRNIRIGFAARGDNSTTFLKWTHGSHHTRLVTRIAATWNGLLGWKTIQKQNLSLDPRPVLQVVDSGEKFGLVASEDAASFGGLIDIIKKEEPRDELLDLTTLHDSDEAEDILRDLNIDPALLSAPATTPISHLKGTTMPTRHESHDLAFESIYPHHPSRTSGAENLEMVAGNGLEANLAVIVSCLTCTSVRCCGATVLHALLYDAYCSSHAQNSGPDK
jgi:hypothetical protein